MPCRDVLRAYRPTCTAVVVDVQLGGCEAAVRTESLLMFERVVSWAKSLKPSQQAAEQDLDELAKLIQEGDPGDPLTLERIAVLLGQSDDASWPR